MHVIPATKLPSAFWNLKWYFIRGSGYLFIVNSLAPALELRTLGSDGPSYKGQFNFCSPTFSFKLSPEVLYLFKSFKFPCFLTKASFISLISVYSIRSKDFSKHTRQSPPRRHANSHTHRNSDQSNENPGFLYFDWSEFQILGETWNLNGA